MASKENKPCSLCWILRFFVLALALIAGLYFGRAYLSAPGNSAASGDLPQLAHATALPAGLKPLPALTLTDMHGQRIDQQALSDKWNFLFIGFTACPDACPTTLGVLNATSLRINETAYSQDTGYIFVSVDPERDTPDRLRQYVQAFNPDFRAVTGETPELNKLTLSLGAVYAKVATGDDNYTIDHSLSLYLISPDGDIRAVFSHPLEATHISQDYAQLRQALEP